ncbi:hypothetical protein AAMO2058_001165400 [Amorphochlora amoebiformis]|mmetsp:Transcript_34680/g.55947  ORF Transcript_34680/g.55947 Transcript_34680/m.55947 type:complete len:208 (-) Transcript_34680:149-772(-)
MAGRGWVLVFMVVGLITLMTCKFTRNDAFPSHLQNRIRNVPRTNLYISSTRFRRSPALLRCKGEEEPKKASSSALDSLNSFFGDDADGGESQTKTEPKKGTVEALFKAAEETSQAQTDATTESKEEAIRKALRTPKPGPKEKEEEQEYETFEAEVKDIGPKFVSYAKALLVLPLTYWPYIVGLLALTLSLVLLSDGQFGARAPPSDF